MDVSLNLMETCYILQTSMWYLLISKSASYLQRARVNVRGRSRSDVSCNKLMWHKWRVPQVYEQGIAKTCNLMGKVLDAG